MNQVYRPVFVDKKGDNGSFIFNSMLEFENAGDILDCRYEITYDGGTLAEGSLDFSAEPMGSAEVFIPQAGQASDKETYIRFIFTAKEDTLSCEKGY